MFNFIKKDTLTWCRSGAFIVNFEYISHLVLVFVPFTLSKYMLAGNIDIRSVLFEFLSSSI